MTTVRDQDGRYIVVRKAKSRVGEGLEAAHIFPLHSNREPSGIKILNFWSLDGLLDRLKLNSVQNGNKLDTFSVPGNIRIFESRFAFSINPDLHMVGDMISFYTSPYAVG